MSRIELAAIALVVGLSTGCASGPSFRTVDLNEASAFERSLKVSEPSKPERERTQVYVQPANKKEPCKLPSSQSQIERGNFRAYWDGGCKNGFAFGLGRDIAISDTHHFEEITIHDGTGDNAGSPRVTYDFVNNKVIYAVPSGNFPAASWMAEEISSSESGFFVSYSLGVTDESGNNLVAISSPLSPSRLFVNDRRTIIYKFTDNSAAPAVNPSEVSFSAETLDPKTRIAGGVAIVRYASGQVQHLKLNGASPEPVVLPPEYVNDLVGKLKGVQDAAVQAQANIERARQMEREYLYMACSGKHAIDGLDNDTATKICGWRGQFRGPYEKALAKYTGDMDQRRKQAESVAQQRLAQQQVDNQQRQFQQQQMQQLANLLSQIGQQARDSGQQMLNSVMNQPTPQVNFAPFSPSGGNQARCVTVGSVTNCRY